MHSRNILESDILAMHELFYKDIDGSYAGKYRDKPVIISGSKYPVCEVDKIADEMKKFADWANTERGAWHPVQYAAQLHKRFVFIHPFIDGNNYNYS